LRGSDSRFIDKQASSPSSPLVFHSRSCN
jgi:hypothetical protein